MRFSTIGLLLGLPVLVLSGDLLFVEPLQGQEFLEASSLGFNPDCITQDQWLGMTTAQFAAYKAIILADNDGDGDLADIQFLENSTAVWSPAVTGNIVLIGTDPTVHYSQGEQGAQVLMDDAIKFAAAGNGTGLYYALSHFYTSVNSSSVPSLSGFGNFQVEGNLTGSCYNDAHIVASSPALASLTDAALSNWTCSVHEAFTLYPSTGPGGFEPLAIALNILGTGSQKFSDGTQGIPYIISRGATPLGCGNGKWEAGLGEDCDDGSLNGTPGDSCSISCKCIIGTPSGHGTCIKGGTTGTGGSISSPISATPVKYGNSTVVTVYACPTTLAPTLTQITSSPTTGPHSTAGGPTTAIQFTGIAASQSSGIMSVLGSALLAILMLF